MKKLMMVLLVALMGISVFGQSLKQSFKHPPDDTKPWVFWFWINGNISQEGITKDLEAMKRVGINGVLWMEVSGPWWAPQGPIEAGTKAWDDAMQWAISEADRLDMDFTLSVDFGYGCGGPHIRPDTSMQTLVWSETAVKGGASVSLRLKKPVVDKTLKSLWLRPGKQLDPELLRNLDEIDSYRDIAVFAIKTDGAALGRIDSQLLPKYDGRGWTTDLPALSGRGSAVSREDIIDVTEKMSKNGTLQWLAPTGDWTVIRLGHACNYQMTRPSPHAAVGLECDRLNTQGMDAHFESHLKPILDAAGDKAGRTLQYIHIDSWEAKGQNWSKGFAEAFKQRRGYDIRPWLPVLTGIVVENADKTERFLWDMRQTVNELMLDNYINRLKALAQPYGVEFSCESYGHFCVDSISYGGRSDFPIAEFWTERQFGKTKGLDAPDVFGDINGPAVFNAYCYQTMKSLASVANTYGKSRVGAEAFTGSRGWVDHPWLIKNMGDQAFSEGINHYIYHLSAHQPYDHMVPGLTHRKWGQHFQRHQTWWEYTRPYFDYVSRCQFLLRQGRTVADFACLYREGAPVNVKDARKMYDFPLGYDYDLCAPEIIQQMTVKNGRMHLPSGVSYTYLVLPKTGRISLETAQKVDALRQEGASIIQLKGVTGTPGLEDYPEADRQVRVLAAGWPVMTSDQWSAIVAEDGLIPDFKGEDIRWIHRRSGSDDIYFVANSTYEVIKRTCTFRVTGKEPELWDPETGKIFALEDHKQSNGQTTVDLAFGPSQSWFVVFRDQPTRGVLKENPFPSWIVVQEIQDHWTLSFDPKWGSDKTLTLNSLHSWSEQSDPLVKYYSGTGTYCTTFVFPDSGVSKKDMQYCLDLGNVEVVARVTLNDNVCGIAWKPPYHVDISDALQTGRNKLKIEVANTWVNRLIGDEQLPLDADWLNWETLGAWPDWFLAGTKRPSGRYTFTSARHYRKDTALHPAGLLGPVRILSKCRVTGRGT